MKETSGLVSLHLGKRRRDICPRDPEEISKNSQTLASSLTGEAASTRGKGNGYRSHAQTPFQVTVSTTRCGDLTDSFARVPDVGLGVHERKKVQGGFEPSTAVGRGRLIWSLWQKLREKLVPQPQKPRVTRLWNREGFLSWSPPFNNRSRKEGSRLFYP